jgi:ABC-type dipeptide/oligopeptide/nickel transport system permease component
MSYVVRRLLLIIPVLFVLSILVFLMIEAIPGDAAARLAGLEGTGADVVSIRHELGLDQPLPVQYVQFLGRIVRLDMGRSFITNIPVSRLLADAFPATIELALASLILALPLGIALGTLGAVRHDTPWDTLATAVAVAGISMPGYWLGLLLIWVLAVQVGWFPTSGRDGILSVVLPATTLSGVTMPIVARMTRSSVLEVLSQEFVRTARAKGLNEQVVLGRHVLRNAAIPVVTVIGLQIGYLFGGSVITETVFAWPGVGRLVVEAIRNRDVPVVQGVIMAIALIFLVVNFVVDVSYAFIDPRIRYE